MKSIIIFIFLILSSALYQSKAQFKIDGIIKPTSGWQNNIYIYKLNDLEHKDLLFDSISLGSDGRFRYTFTFSQSVNSIYKFILPPINEKSNTLIEGYRDNYFFITPQNKTSCRLTAQADSVFYSLKIEGSPLNKEINFFPEFKRPFANLCKSLESKIMRFPDSVSYFQNQYADEWIKSIEYFKEESTKYLLKTKKSAVILIGFYHLCRANFGKLNDPYVNNIINKISNKKYPLYSSIIAKIKSISNNRVQVKLPISARLLDTTKNILHYNLRSDSLTIINFWASWCTPCRESNRTTLKQLYQNLGLKKIRLIGISIDLNFNDWARAIEKDKTQWQQFIEDRTAVLQKILDINSVPIYLVVNNNQEIIFETSSTTLLTKFIEKY